MAQDVPELLKVGEGFLLLDTDLLDKPYEVPRVLSVNTVDPQDIIVHAGLHGSSQLSPPHSIRSAELTTKSSLTTGGGETKEDPFFGKDYDTEKVTDRLHLLTG